MRTASKTDGRKKKFRRVWEGKKKGKKKCKQEKERVCKN